MIPDPPPSPEQLRAQLAAIVESSDDAIIGKTPEGIITSWNRSAERLYGYRADEAIGRPITLIIPPELPDEFPSIMSRLLRGERVDHYETIRVHKDGHRLDVSVTISPVKDADGRVVGASAIARDISAHRRMEAERQALLEREQQARRIAEEANRAKDEFLATLSHELRTPLTPIVAWTAMLRSGRLPPERHQRALDAIDRSARAQVRLVDDLLDISGIVTGKFRIDPAPVDLARVIGAAVDVVRPAAAAKGVELTALVDPLIGPVWGDAGRLQQAIRNLLANAVKFTPDGGSVEVRLERDAGRARVTVRDTGVGMDPAFLPHVFDRFRQADSSSTRHHGGLGLGLAIVRSIVELHGGSVAAASDGPGRGATFTVTLPLIPEPAQTPGAPESATGDGAAPTPETLAGLRVLVAEDDPEAREMVQAALESFGASAEVVASAADALAAAERAAPDVLVSDLGMPGEDGYMLLDALRARGRDVPAVALTGYGDPANRRRALAAGFARYLVKPVEPAELAAVLAGLARPAGDGARKA